MDPVDMVKTGFSAVVTLCKSIHATRPKAHKERVTRLKNRLSVVEQQLRLVEGSASTHVQQSMSNLEEVLNDMLRLLRNLEDEKWIKRTFKNICNMDGDFEELNVRLSQESLALVLSLNIDARVMQQTFNTERRRREDEIDRTEDLKLLEEMRETLFSVKKDTEQIIEMIENKKSGGSTPGSPVEIKVEVTHNHTQSSPPPPPPYTGFMPAPPQYPVHPHQQPVYPHQQPVYPHQQPVFPHQQPVQMTQPMQTVQTQQPQVVICSGDLGNIPTMTTCPHCHQKAQTRVVYHSGSFAWLICGLSTVFGLVCGCCVIPFFMDSCKDAHHFCSSCNANLGIHKRL